MMEARDTRTVSLALKFLRKEGVSGSHSQGGVLNGRSGLQGGKATMGQ